MLSLTLLGQVELSKDGERLRTFRSQKEPALLIYLAQTGQAQPRDAIAELLWETGSLKQALSNLRTVIARMQEYVGDALLVTHKSLTLAPQVCQQVDSVRLLQTLATITQVTSEHTAQELQQALDTYRGDFLAGFHVRNAPQFDQWVATTREYIHHEVLVAYQRLAQYAESVGNIDYAIAIAKRWLQHDALDEAAQSLLIRSLLMAGNERDALTQYQQYTALLHAELGIGPSAALTALVAELRPTRATPPRIFGTVRHNIPADYDAFIGRQATQQQIDLRLNQPWCRLVTIVGQGGVGKTRLATTVARDRRSHYPDGVWLVELADLDQHDEHLTEAIAVEIATALDLRFTGAAKPTTQLLDYLQHRQLLLILDNLEHLLEGVQIILDIVRRCEHVQLLVTSREALDVRGEWTVRLDGLSYPTSEMDDAPTEAVDLFLTRQAQQQVAPNSAEELTAVRRICRVVGGLPLAIELAAALTRHSTPHTIVERLEAGFAALTTTLRDMPDRHQSLQIVFEMSWRTLTPVLQQGLAQLAVFRGGFTADAAQQIAEVDDRQLATLCAKSLVAHDPDTDRYALHPVIRAYANDKRADEQTPQHHARYYLGLLAAHSEPLQRERPQDSMRVLEPDIENLRLAWHTGLANQQADELVNALTSLSIYYQLRGLAQEAEVLMHTTMEAAATWARAGMRLVIRAGLERARFQNRLGQYWQAMQTSQATLKLAAGMDQWAEGMAHILWGESLWRLGKYDAARKNLTHALQLGKVLGATQLIGWCHHHLGIIDDIQGRYPTAQMHFQQACQGWQQLGNISTLSVSLNSLGLVYYHQGYLSNAQKAMEQALALCEQVDNRHLQALLLNNLSMIATEQADYVGAQGYLQRGLELAIASGNLTGQAELHINLGRNYYLLGDLEQAVDYLEVGLHLSEILGDRSLTAIAILNLGKAKRRLGDISRAESLYNQVLPIVRIDNLRLIECEVLLELVELQCTTIPRQAQQYIAEAVTVAQTIENPQLFERAMALANELGVADRMGKKSRSA